MSTPSAGGVPVLILKEGSERSRGRDAQHTNIMAAKVIAETVKSALGPKGMDKMLVDSFGDVTITSDGRTILDEMDIQHPSAKMMVEVAKTQDDEAGDGTTTAVIISGALLEKAEELIQKKVHPTIIIDGYKKASEKALETLEKISIAVKIGTDEYLKKSAMTSMASKLVAEHREYLADLAVKSVLQIADKKDGVYKVDVELDQIVTFHRVSLAHLYAYFIKHFLGSDFISMMNLLHKVIHIHASIKETADTRKIILDYNKKDRLTMNKLANAIKKINSLNVIGPQGKRMEFFLEKQLS